MSPQLTLQTPLQIPSDEIPTYLNQLWSNDQFDSKGSNTFCLIIWQPAWVEQQLVRTGKISGPIVGNQRQEVINIAREVISKHNLPHSTPPLDSTIAETLALIKGNTSKEDLRGQYISGEISALQPRRLITLAPTLDKKKSLETLVAAYCPLLEEKDSQSACGDVIVLRGNKKSLNTNLEKILNPLIPNELPSWVWWNGSLDEASDLFSKLASTNRRLIIDTAIGEPHNCLNILKTRVNTKQAINDLNWLRLRSWRETLAMVFDAPERRESLNHIIQVDIDIEGTQPVQGLLLVAWLADRLGWELESSKTEETGDIRSIFIRSDKAKVQFHLMPLPIGKPSINPGQIVGIRLICNPKNNPKKSICVIIGAESGECIRLEAGGMANMELIEEVVPIRFNPVEKDVSRLLASSRGTTSPLLQKAAPLAAKLLT